MKTVYIVLAFLILSSFSTPADKLEETKDKIVAEGTLLYRSEMASWYGTDLFQAQCKDQVDNAGGYFSYTDDKLTKCVFFSNGERPQAIATITFDETYNVQTAAVDKSVRDFSKQEKELYQIRQTALQEVQKDTTFYKRYTSLDFNLIPVINGNNRKVYITSASEVEAQVIFGNDYLLEFDRKGRLINRKRLHQGVIRISYKPGKAGDITYHTHAPETGEYPTATDICTLMLYQRATQWKQHIIMAPHYVSLWDYEKNTLLILTREAWDKIYKRAGQH